MHARPRRFHEPRKVCTFTAKILFLFYIFLLTSFYGSFFMKLKCALDALVPSLKQTKWCISHVKSLGTAKLPGSVNFHDKCGSFTTHKSFREVYTLSEPWKFTKRSLQTSRFFYACTRLRRGILQYVHLTAPCTYECASSIIDAPAKWERLHCETISKRCNVKISILQKFLAKQCRHTLRSYTERSGRGAFFSQPGQLQKKKKYRG